MHFSLHKSMFFVNSCLSRPILLYKNLRAIMKSVDIDSLLKSLQKFPEFLRSRDLVLLGLFGSKFAVRNAQRRGNAPPSIKISFNRILFPKNLLVQWLVERNDGNIIKKTDLKTEQEYLDGNGCNK